MATPFASKQSVLERVILMNPVAKLAMSSPKYSEKYEDQDVESNNDSGDGYAVKEPMTRTSDLRVGPGYVY